PRPSGPPGHSVPIRRYAIGHVVPPGNDTAWACACLPADIKISLYVYVKGWDLSHMRPAPLDFDSLHAALRAAGEGTRLRVLALLAEADLTVSDLTKILRQSQPRISRHLKLL